MEKSSNADFSRNLGTQQGCGPPQTEINIQITPTTGGDFLLRIATHCSVEELKRTVAKRLKVPKDRICLLFRNKQLQDGHISQYGIVDGSSITLVPNVETGLLKQRSEIDIIQALESLNDSQVNEFLGGKAPLNLSMRLGNHIMLIQLQLSTIHSLPSSSSTSKLSKSTSSTTGTTATDSTTPKEQNEPPPSLIQASRNLQHTLKRLSSDLFTGKDHRENIYSGTFHGALNPALQDTRGRPRRNIATIVHILNDLLCSVPEFRRFSGYRSSNHNSTNVTTDSVVENENSSTIADDLVAVDDGSLPSTSTAAASSSSASTIYTDNSNTTEIMSDTDQNLRTRGKVEQLRLVMGKRREQRRQRRQKPYSVPANDSDTVIA